VDWNLFSRIHCCPG